MSKIREKGKNLEKKNERKGVSVEMISDLSSHQFYGQGGETEVKMSPGACQVLPTIFSLSLTPKELSGS